MANTIKDAKNAALGAVMDIQLATQQFALEWNAPDLRRAQAVVETQMLNKWDASAPQIEAIKEQKPEAHKRAAQQIKVIRDRTGG